MLRELFRDKSPAQLAMMAAITLSFLSQFMLYSDAYQSFIVSTDGYGVLNFLWPENLGRHSGWEMHWHAGPTLVVLAFSYFRDDVVNAGWFSKFGWWSSVLLLLAVMIPLDWDFSGFGELWGLISLAVAITAALMHGREVRRSAAVTARDPAAKP